MLESYVQGKAQAREKALALRATLHGFPMVKSDGGDKEEVKLPQVVQDRERLVNYYEGWPTPRPSPHYKLRVFHVLSEATEMRETFTCLFRKENRILPAITSGSGAWCDRC